MILFCCSRHMLTGKVMLEKRENELRRLQINNLLSVKATHNAEYQRSLISCVMMKLTATVTA